MFLFDSNTFMEASRSYYGFDFAPGFWDWLISDEMAGQIASVEAVLEEINVGEGLLVDWVAEKVPPGFWLPDTGESIASATQLVAWATHVDRVFTSAAVDEFVDSADLRLIAQAHAVKATVVTRETSDPNCKKRVKIPEACRALGVECRQPFEVYSTLGLRLTR